jgi:acetyl esterase/lipase
MAGTACVVGEVVVLVTSYAKSFPQIKSHRRAIGHDPDCVDLLPVSGPVVSDVPTTFPWKPDSPAQATEMPLAQSGDNLAASPRGRDTCSVTSPGEPGLPVPQAPDGLELRHMRAFVVQPALSRQIGKLERLIGCELVRRDSHHVSITAAGEVFDKRCRHLLELVDGAVADTRAVGGELAARILGMWKPVEELMDVRIDRADVRAAFEDLYAEFPVPAGPKIRSVNADGVPSLRITPACSGDTTILFVHGGGYWLGSAFAYRSLATAIALVSASTVIVPDYRLAPEHPYPAPVTDVYTAYKWLARRMPAQRIAVVGDDTGAMVALSTLLRLRDERHAMPGCAVLMSPGTGVLQRTASQPAWQELHTRLQSAYLGGCPLDDPIANPTVADLSGLPPLLMQVPNKDRYFGSGGLALAERARACGVSVRLEADPVAGHGYQTFWWLAPKAADAVRHVGEFIRGCVGGDSVADEDQTGQTHQHG